MKLVTFEAAAGVRRVGAVVGDHSERVIDLTAAASATPQAALFADMLSLIDGGEVALDQARNLIRAARQTAPMSGVRLLSPIPVPRRFRDFLSFELHVRQSRANRHLFGIETEPRDPAKIQIPKVWYDRPIYYKSNCFSVVGPEAEIHWPSYSLTVDYELEVALVVGRQGQNLSTDTAPQHVFGYCIFNDFSARDVQYAEMPGSLGPSKGKDFDTGNALGPWIATADEVDPQNLTMIARVNGEEWSRGSSRDMRFRFEDFIEHVSTDERIRAGEFFGSGTVGSGCGLELGKFLNDGDVVELEVSGLGVLRNKVVRNR